MALVPPSRPDRTWIFAPEGSALSRKGWRWWSRLAAALPFFAFFFWLSFDSSQAGYGRPQEYVAVVTVTAAIGYALLVAVLVRSDLVARRLWPAAAVRLEPSPAITTPLRALVGVAHWKSLTDIVTITVGRGDFTLEKGSRLRHVWLHIESRGVKLRQISFGEADLDFDWEGWVRTAFAFVPSLVVTTGPDPR